MSNETDEQLLEFIKLELSSIQENELNDEKINFISYELWKRTNFKKARCIDIINKLSSKIKKITKFKELSIAYIQKLAESTNKNTFTNSIKNQTIEDVYLDDDEYLDQIKAKQEEIDKSYPYSSAIGFGIVFGIMGGFAGKIIAVFLEVGDKDSLLFISGFAGILVAVILNYHIRKKI
tara:strand:+ start:439 stop:972 length:534 start_codon:yes stop_codon:yes gene_type:complete